MAAVTRPTTIKMAPAIPASVSDAPYGLRIWFNSDETLLKKPT